jgi:hypothetical protein
MPEQRGYALHFGLTRQLLCVFVTAQMLVQQGVVAVVTLAAFLSLFILIPFCQ